MISTPPSRLPSSSADSHGGPLSAEFQAERYRDVFEATGNATVVVDPLGRVVLANDRFAEFAGVNRSTIETHGWDRFIHREDKKRLERFRVSRVAGEQSPTEFEFTFARPDGTFCRVHATARLMNDGRHTVYSLSNLSGRASMEEMLRENERRYRTLADFANDIILVTELDGIITFANPAALREVGVTEVPENASVLDWIPSVYHTRIQELYKRRMSGWNGSHVFEVEIISADGTRHPIEVSTVSIPRNDRPPEILVVARDISDRKAVERVTRQEKRRLRSVLETAHAYIALFDADGRFTLANRRYAEVLGKKIDDLIGKRPEDVVPEDLWEVMKTRLPKLRTGEVVRFEQCLCLPGSDGKRWYSGTYNPILSADGQYQGHVAVTLDITEQKEAEINAQVRETLDVARKLARTVAHEFRQPLTALRMIADLTRLNNDPEFREKNLQRIPDLVDRLDKLVTRLLEITSLESKPYLHDLDILDLKESGRKSMPPDDRPSR